MEHINKKILRFFESLSDETRLMIALSLINGPKNVNEIHCEVGRERLTLSAISHQLRLLRSSGIVDSKKKGREKFFTLSEHFCWCILRDAQSHFKQKTGCAECRKLMKK